jgi:hypothetical protein
VLIQELLPPLLNAVAQHCCLVAALLPRDLGIVERCYTFTDVVAIRFVQLAEPYLSVTAAVITATATAATS